MSAAQYDVIVIGGGPGGSSTAALLARAGRRVLVVEREAFPRYQIGESLIPYTYRFLARTGALAAVQAAGFVPKPGFHFVSPGGTVTRPIYFNHYMQDPEFCCYEVERARFDQILLDHARACGAEVREQTAALEPVRDGERVVGLRLRGPDGVEQELRARFVVDASGRSTFLASRFATKRRDPVLDQLAVWRYARGARRQPGLDAGNILVALLAPRGWFWWIPLRDDVTSIGVVSSASWLRANGDSLPEIFDANLQRNPMLSEWLLGSEWISEHRTAADYSYKSTRFCGPGWLAVGDAAAFIDPVFSSGMFLSLACALMAADAIDGALADPDDELPLFADYTTYVSRASVTFRMFLDAFYDENVTVRQLFIDHPEQVDEWGRVLQGDVFADNRPFLRFLLDYRAGAAHRAGRAPQLYIPPDWDEGAQRRPLRLRPPLELSERRALSALQRARGQLHGDPDFPIWPLGR